MAHARIPCISASIIIRVKQVIIVVLSGVLWLPAAAAVQPPDISGYWAAQTVTSQILKVPVLGEVTSESHAILLVHVRQKGKRLRVRQKLCGLKVATDTSSLHMLVPKAFVRATKSVSVRAELVYEQGKWKYVQKDHSRVFGAKLKRPELDPLPTRRDDPRVLDYDGDGRPGVTLKVKGMVTGSIYAVTRDTISMRGEMSGDMRSVEGVVGLHRERIVLGASNPLLGGSPASRAHPDPERSYFRMKKLEKKMRCRELRGVSRNLFNVN